MTTDPLALATRSGLPDDLLVLYRRYPREVWDGHTNLGEFARFWLARHTMFRELHAALVGEVEGVLARERDAAAIERQFGRYAAFFLGELEMHHNVEDQHYFPILTRLDARLERGFAMLDRDHDAIHHALLDLRGAAVALLRAVRLPEARLLPLAESVQKALVGLQRPLARHLGDEEEIVVPLILERGEAALHGG